MATNPPVPEFKPTEVVTAPVRLVFPHLFEPKPAGPFSDGETYEAGMLLPPDFDLSTLRKAVKAALIEKYGADPKSWPKLEGRSNPLKRAEEVKSLAKHEGWFFVRTSTGYAPTVVDQRRQEILDPARIFAGCWCRFHVTAYVWDNKFGKGVSFSLNSVQLVRTDTRLGGGRPATEVFTDIDASEAGAEPDDGLGLGGDSDLPF